MKKSSILAGKLIAGWLACIGVTMWGQVHRIPSLAMQTGSANPAAATGLSLSQHLPTTTRIDINLDGKWTRGNVSEDDGPSATKIKVRVDPENRFMIVPRNSIRLAARPTHIAIGDHFEWYDSSVFRYVPAFVKGTGTGSYAGYYLMAYDSNPSSGGMYSKPENLFLPLTAANTAQAGAASASGKQPALGKYRCYSYSTPTAPPILLGEIDLRGGGSYSGHNLGGRDQEGRYTYDTASQTLNWTSGWMKENKFGGKLEGNALIRIAPTSICSHE